MIERMNGPLLFTDRFRWSGVSKPSSTTKISECCVSRTTPMARFVRFRAGAPVYGAICKPWTICDTVWNWADVHNAFTFLSMSHYVHWRPLLPLVFRYCFLRFIGRPYNYHKLHARNRRVNDAWEKFDQPSIYRDEIVPHKRMILNLECIDPWTNGLRIWRSKNGISLYFSC